MPQPAASTDPPQTIESDDPLVLQTGTWTAVNTSNASGGSYLYASSPADTLTLDFYGTSIEVVYVEDPAFGAFTVEIDNNAVRTVTATGTSTVFDVHSVFEYLDDGPHTLRIIGIQGTVAIDAFYAIPYFPPIETLQMTSEDTPSIVYLCADNNICIRSTDTSNPRQELTTGGGFKSPVWSPDGTEIMYLDGSTFRVIEEGVPVWPESWSFPVPVGHPTVITELAWAADQTNRIAYTVWVSALPYIYCLKYDTGDPCDENFSGYQLFAANGQHPTWSPDGSLAYEFANSIHVNDLNGNDTIIAEPDVGNPIARFVQPAWSPDGEWIAYAYFPGGTGSQDISTLYRMKPDGTLREKLITEEQGDRLLHPAWSPDSDQLVFEWDMYLCFDCGGGSGSQWDSFPLGIYKVDLLTSLPITFTDVNFVDYPGFRPDWRGQPSCRIAILDDAPDPLAPQILIDMKAVVTDAGLHVHSAPSINSPKAPFDPQSTDKFVPMWQQGAFLEWEAEAWVDARLELGGQIWYHLNSYQNPSENRRRVDGWIAIQFIFTNDPTVYNYLQDGITNPDPCFDREPPDEITFYYDRYAAVTYATAHSYQNEVVPPPIMFNTQRLNGSIVSFPSGINPTAIPYAFFRTNSVEHEPPKTGSAAYISEGLWMGGMLFTRDLDDTPTSVGSCGRIPPDTNDYGWRHCTVGDGTASDGNGVWIRHEWIVAYYTQNVLPIGMAPFTPLNQLPSSSKGNAIPMPPSPDVEAIPAVESDTAESGVELITGVVTDPATIAMLVEATLIDPRNISDPNDDVGLIRFGDYAWINSTSEGSNTTHGLLVAGWGETQDCADVIAPTTGQRVILDNADLFETYEDSIGSIMYPIPYVVDFSYQLQQPIPRPFYCTQYRAPGWSFFISPHDWFFFVLPNEATISSDVIFVDPEWIWTASHGIITP